MTKILIVAEHLDGKLNASTAKCVSCAKQMAPSAIEVVVLAADPAGPAAAAAQIDGVTKVRTIANAANAHALSQVLAPQVAALAADYTHVLGPSTTFGKDLMPCVAALLGEAQVSDVMKAHGARKFERPIYAGNAIVTVSVPDSRKVIATVRTASYPAAGKAASAAPVEAATVNATLPSHTRFVELKAGASATEADIIAFCRSQMPGFKTPKKVVFAAIPKTSTGKIQKFVLRDQAKSATAFSS